MGVLRHLPLLDVFSDSPLAEPDQVSGFKQMRSDEMPYEEEDDAEDATTCDHPAAAGQAPVLFDRFCRALKDADFEDLLVTALKQVAKYEADPSNTGRSGMKGSLWNKINDSPGAETLEAKTTEHQASNNGGGFLFGFDLAEGEE